MTPTQIVGAALIVVGGSFVQTIAGFGMGLFSVPLLLYLGFPLSDAVALAVGAGLVQLLIGLRTVHREVAWREASAMALIQALFVPVGMMGMQLLEDAGPARVKQGVGALLFTVLAVRQFWRPVPRDSLPRIWTVIAGSVSGTLAGLAGMGGPPLVLYALAHRYSIDRYRAFLWSQFALIVPVMVITLGLRFGWSVLLAFGLGLVLTPCLWVGARIGMRVSARWEVATVQRIAVGLLYVIAISGALGPWLAAR
ncbi:MAG: sulfite exporter TauE/SafE family protein [Polyangiales bacterium]|nr:sulfite exporter TauE/SafE family protein [Myxococcales bacterium]MCB9660443.1 sulfite exporter TauE/SafE family protein [Sandaracinaceae bacterium]